MTVSILIYLEILFICDDGKAEFSPFESSLQGHMILQKSFYYVDLFAQKNISFLSMLKKTVVLLNIFVETLIFFFSVYIEYKV